MSSLQQLPTIYLLEPFPPEVIGFCRTIFHTIDCTDPEVSNWRENAPAILVREKTISASDIEHAQKLRVIEKQGVGIDIIDQETCAQRGIPIMNTPGANSQSVAELVLALTMAVARQLRPISVQQVAGKEVRKEHCCGIGLAGKSVGILGMGNIGLAVARIFYAAFGSPICVYDPYAPSDSWKDIPHTRFDSVDTLIPHVDVLTPHLPLTSKTRNLISWPQFEKMRANSILINAARGGIINEGDLVRALDEGILWGAGLDCHEEEPPTLARYRLLWKTGNVVSTPHIGATTTETQIRTGMTALRRVHEYLMQA